MLFIKHTNDVPCLPLRTGYPTSNSFDGFTHLVISLHVVPIPAGTAEDLLLSHFLCILLLPEESATYGVSPGLLNCSHFPPKVSLPLFLRSCPPFRSVFLIGWEYSQVPCVNSAWIHFYTSALDQLRPYYQFPLFGFF